MDIYTVDAMTRTHFELQQISETLRVLKTGLHELHGKLQISMIANYKPLIDTAKTKNIKLIFKFHRLLV